MQTQTSVQHQYCVTMEPLASTRRAPTRVSVPSVTRAALAYKAVSVKYYHIIRLQLKVCEWGEGSGKGESRGQSSPKVKNIKCKLYSAASTQVTEANFGGASGTLTTYNDSSAGGPVTNIAIYFFNYVHASV
jgi:hypothetical protein